MAGYGSFAYFYDRLTGNVDYKGWAAYILKLFQKHAGEKPQQVIDLACGTGSLSLELLRNDVDVIGVDGSVDMLAEATDKLMPYGERAMLLCQDVRALDLYGTADGAVCMLDSLNHLLKTADLQAVFERLGLFIKPDGLFVFDVNTLYKHETVLGDNAFVYEQEDFFCAWQNSYLPHTKEVVMQLDFFVEQDGCYDRYSEQIRERAYTENTLRRLLKTAGFEVLAVYGERGMHPPAKDEQRMVFVTKNLAIKQR